MSMHYEYKPSGVCSTNIILDIDNGVITNLSVERGCNGNLQGIAQLVKGRKVEEVISLLDGIKCGMKTTSCPDQIAQALKQYHE